MKCKPEPKAEVKHEPYLEQVSLLNTQLSSRTPQSITKFIAKHAKNLVTPKAGAKKELFPQSAPN